MIILTALKMYERNDLIEKSLYVNRVFKAIVTANSVQI